MWTSLLREHSVWDIERWGGWTVPAHLSGCTHAFRGASEKGQWRKSFSLLRIFVRLGAQFCNPPFFLKIILPFQNDFECYDFWIFCAAIMTGKIRVMNQSLAWRGFTGRIVPVHIFWANRRIRWLHGSGLCGWIILVRMKSLPYLTGFGNYWNFQQDGLAEYAVPELVEQLRLLSAFYALRMTIRQSHLFSRVFYCLKHQADYRFLASGIRSMIRDIIFWTKPEQEKEHLSMKKWTFGYAGAEKGAPLWKRSSF